MFRLILVYIFTTRRSSDLRVVNMRKRGGAIFDLKKKLLKERGGLEKRKMRRIVHSFLRYHRGLKMCEDVQMTQIFFCPCCSFVSFMIESALHFISRTYILQVITLTTFEMSPNHAKSCQDGPNFQWPESGVNMFKKHVLMVYLSYIRAY